MKSERIKKLLPVLIAAGVIGLALLLVSLPGETGVAKEGDSNNYESANPDHSGQYSYVINLDANAFEGAISEGLVLVDFWADWCPPCRIQNPILEELAAEVHEYADITKLDVDQFGDIAAGFGVRSIPTLILFRDGEIVERFVGVQQKETLLAAIEEHL